MGDPAFTAGALIGVALPLFIVTMASQNVPGVAVIRASGYAVPISPLIGWTGVANVALAPFGAFALNLAAITAAIGMGREAHEDPRRRYVAAVTAGLLLRDRRPVRGHRGGLFAAFPRELVAAIAGLALLATIGNGLAAALARRGSTGARARHVPGDRVRRALLGRRLGVLGTGGGSRDPLILRAGGRRG